MKKELLKEEVDQILAQCLWGKGGITLSENTEAQADEVEQTEEEVVEEAVEEGHVCPLCESHLEAPISDEKLSEHIDLMVDIIDEMAQLTEGDVDEDGDTLAEASDEDEDDGELPTEEDSKPKSSVRGRKMDKSC